MKCPCGSNLEYISCCEIYHLGKEKPKTAVALMRSRYSAYFLHLADYIIKTTHFKNPNRKTDEKLWEAEILNFCENTKLEKLEILTVEEQETKAIVTFCVFFLQNDKKGSFIEKSFFEKVDGFWLYYNGEFLSC